MTELDQATPLPAHLFSVVTKLPPPPQQLTKKQLEWWNETLADLLRLWAGPPPTPARNRRLADSGPRERRNHFMYLAHKPSLWETLSGRLRRSASGRATGKRDRAFRALAAMKDEAELYGTGICLERAADALALYIEVSKDPELLPSGARGILGKSIYSAYMKWKRERQAALRVRR